MESDFKNFAEVRGRKCPRDFHMYGSSNHWIQLTIIISSRGIYVFCKCTLKTTMFGNLSRQNNDNVSVSIRLKIWNPCRGLFRSFQIRKRKNDENALGITTLYGYAIIGSEQQSTGAVSSY